MNLFILCQFYGLLQQVLPSTEEGGDEGSTSELEFWGTILPSIASFSLPLLCVKPKQCAFILICSHMLIFIYQNVKSLKEQLLCH